jgi:DNA-binding transcriptional LysR family regulator
VEAVSIRQSTVSRRLRDLEYRLGAILFERTKSQSPELAMQIKTPPGIGRRFES